MVIEGADQLHAHGSYVQVLDKYTHTLSKTLYVPNSFSTLFRFIKGLLRTIDYIVLLLILFYCCIMYMLL